MAITTVEMLSLAPKSQEASFLKTMEVQKPVNEQIALGQRMQTEVMRKSEQTSEVKHTEEPEYRYDASDGGTNGFMYQRDGSRKNKKENNDGKEENIKRFESGARFDMKI